MKKLLAVVGALLMTTTSLFAGGHTKHHCCYTRFGHRRFLGCRDKCGGCT